MLIYSCNIFSQFHKTVETFSKNCLDIRTTIQSDCIWKNEKKIPEKSQFVLTVFEITCCPEMTNAMKINFFGNFFQFQETVIKILRIFVNDVRLGNIFEDVLIFWNLKLREQTNRPRLFKNENFCNFMKLTLHFIVLNVGDQFWEKKPVSIFR